MISRNGPHGEAVSPTVVVLAPIRGTEVQAIAAVGTAGRGRPTVAVGAHTGRGSARTVAAKACSRQEDGVAVRPGDFHAADPVLLRPLPFAVINEFPQLSFRWYTEVLTEDDGGGIVLSASDASFNFSILISR